MRSKYIKILISLTIAASITAGYTTTAVLALDSPKVKTEEKSKEQPIEELENKKGNENKIEEEQKKEDVDKIQEDEKKEESKEEETKKDEPTETKENNKVEKEDKEIIKENNNRDNVNKKEENKKENAIPIEEWKGNYFFTAEVCNRTGIKDIEDVTYDDIKKVKTLDLSWIPLEIPEILKKFEGLESINLSFTLNTSKVLEYVSNIKGLKELDISARFMGDLGPYKAIELPESMSNLTNLERIDISGLQYGSIPEVILKMPKLQYIEAKLCNINSIPEDISKFKKLVSLELGDNNINNIPSSLSKIKSLRYLGLEGNNISEIPKEIFNITKLEDLVLRNNNLVSIPNEIKNMNGDKTKFTLDVSANQILNLPELKGQNIIYNSNFISAFKNGINTANKLELTQKVLDINGNDSISQDNLRKLVKVRYDLGQQGGGLADLDSRHNIEFVIENKIVTPEQLLDLDEGVYDAKIKLQGAELSNEAAITSNIIKIKVGNVEVSIDQDEINIPEDATGKIPLNYWEDCRPLMRNVVETLQVDNIENVTYEDIAKIETVDLTYQELTHIPKILSKFKGIKNLCLSGNNLIEVPSIVYEFNNLEFLILGNNKISKIPGELSKLDNLELLDLNSNDICKIDDDFKEIKNLKALNLNSNKNIGSEINKIWSIKSLEEVCIGDCNLTEISEEINNLSNYAKVLFDNNQLVRIPENNLRNTSERLNIFKNDDIYMYKQLSLTKNNLEFNKAIGVSQDKLRDLVELKSVMRDGLITNEQIEESEKVLPAHNITFVINGKEYTEEEARKFRSGTYKAQLKIQAADIDNTCAITEESINLTITGKDDGQAITPTNPSSNSEQTPSTSSDSKQTLSNIALDNMNNSIKKNNTSTINSLPKTGGMSAMLLSLFGIGAIGSGVAVGKIKKKK